ncbi:MAG TPA: SCO family protein [Parvularcula sp.]|nr:SCO family protein [Parvularcula sp.]HBS30244.1 SCO family protein [Parvularcula sp.]HBS34189.1 SCO family protein [Parvularcula sp.]
MKSHLAFAAALFAAACGATDEGPPPAGVIALSDQFKADFALIDQNGRTMTAADLKGRVGVVYFGFASCPDVCPLALGRLGAALNELSEAERAKVAPLFITVDPDRDTPSKLKDYLAFDERIIGLTGDRAAIEAAKANYKVFAEPEPVEDSALGYTMQHSSLFYLVNRDGELQYALQDTLTPAEIADAIRRAL